MKCVISVLGKDRTGIVAAVATALTECSANIDDINQTILGQEELFSMTMLVTLNVDACPFNEVQERLAAKGEELGCQVTIQREDVFRFMHEV
ncbi:MAG: ACT domain-containing protein [Eggerthellaceae bacterium]|nr:ACT domain-containing protein [Eggerthellaceae bacterium]